MVQVKTADKRQRHLTNDSTCRSIESVKSLLKIKYNCLLNIHCVCIYCKFYGHFQRRTYSVVIDAAIIKEPSDLHSCRISFQHVVASDKRLLFFFFILEPCVKLPVVGL